MSQTKNRKHETGFTLVEILIVILIVGIIAAALLPNLGGFTNSSQVGVVETDLRLIKNNLQEHYIDDPNEPFTSNRIKKYLGYSATLKPSEKVDPSTFLLEKKDPWGNPYQLIIGNEDELFILFQSLGPNEVDDLDINGIDGNIEDDILILHLPEF